MSPMTTTTTAEVRQAWLARGEHPRPLLQRDRWRSLDGCWQFAYDDESRWSEPSHVTYDREIQVPFPPESRASGIGESGFHPVGWYRRLVALEARESDERLLLHFGAVDYQARVWVNGQLVVEHEGGHTPFFADITAAAADGTQIEIVVRAADDPHDLAQPRGKQDWLEQPHEIWYPRTTAIWQTVWLEPVPARGSRGSHGCRLENWERASTSTSSGRCSRMAVRIKRGTASRCSLTTATR